MQKILLTILILLFFFVCTAQKRLVKPDMEGVNPAEQGYFPEPEILFPEEYEQSKSILFFEKRIENANGRGGGQVQAKILFCIAELNRIKGMNDKAVFALMDAYNSVKKDLNEPDKLILQSRLCYNYVVLQKDELQQKFSFVFAEMGYKNFEELMIATTTALEIVEDEKNLLAMYRTSFLYYQLQNDMVKAYKFGDKLIKYKDYVASLQLKRQLTELKDRYQMVQKEQDIQLLNNQKIIFEEKMRTSAREQWAIIGGIVILMIFVIALWHRLRSMRKVRDMLAAKAAQYQHEKNRAEKNELFKEQFLANVSHEIRTPMNAIMGITNILIRNKHPNFQEKYLTAMHESSKNLLVLINDILDLSKLEAGKLELINAPFNPREVVTEIYEKLKDLSDKKGLEFKLEITDDVPETLSGDGFVLNNIILNLVSNAISFTQSGGVGLKCYPGESAMGISALKFEVSDTGMGIVPEKQDKILKTFVKVYDNDAIQYKGSGLELAIISQLIDLQGGSIRLESEPGEGTTFFLELPFQTYSEPILEKEEEIEAPADKLKDINVLLVEDNEFNVMVASTELESSIEGLKLSVAGNGAIALEKVVDEEFDIILMDIQMPVMDGYEATRKIRKLKGPKGKIPIIAMTANVLQQEVDKCLKEGMNDYISKPFDTDKLLTVMKKLVLNSGN